eukprot:10008920-Heterocapsa_arctica.AAC.1
MASAMRATVLDVHWHGERNGRERPANIQQCEQHGQKQCARRLLGVHRGGTSGGPRRHRDAQGRIAGTG